MNIPNIIYNESKSAISLIRTSIASPRIRAEMFMILSKLVTFDDKAKTYDYSAHRGIKSYLKTVVPREDRLQNILKQLMNLGIITLDKKDKNRFGKDVLTIQIDTNFQEDIGPYTFCGCDAEYVWMEKIKAANVKRMQRRWNDGQITLPKELLDTLDPDFDEISSSSISLLQRRSNGEDIPSIVKRSRCKRYFGTFSNFSTAIRNELIDNGTGYKLAWIDNKASQVSFLVAYLKQNTSRSGTNSMKEELKKLDDIQLNSSFHDFVSSKVGYSRDAVKKLVMKVLFGDWRTHDTADLYSKINTDEEKEKLFGKEAREYFSINKLDIVDCWKKMIDLMKNDFPNIYRYMLGIMKRKNKASVADITQSMEGEWMKKLQAKLHSFSLHHTDFQYFTLHDAVYFSAQYFDVVDKLFHQNNEYWSIHYSVTISYKKYNPLSDFNNNVATLPPPLQSSSLSASLDNLESNNFVRLTENVPLEKEEKKRDTISMEQIELKRTKHTLLNAQKRKRASTVRILKDGRFTTTVNEKNYISRKNETKEQFQERVNKDVVSKNVNQEQLESIPTQEENEESSTTGLQSDPAKSESTTRTDPLGELLQASNDEIDGSYDSGLKIVDEFGRYL